MLFAINQHTIAFIIKRKLKTSYLGLHSTFFICNNKQKVTTKRNGKKRNRTIVSRTLPRYVQVGTTLLVRQGGMQGHSERCLCQPRTPTNEDDSRNHAAVLDDEREKPMHQRHQPKEVER